MESIGTWLRYSALNFALLIASVPTLIRLHEEMGIWSDYLKVQERSQGGDRGQSGLSKEIFDFIIIGGGSAGSVVANRLSKEYKVLIIEAGGDPSPISEIPMAVDGLFGTNMTFTYRTTPQKDTCCGIYNNRVVNFPRGKGLGGSSNINGMMYVRGNPKDFDNWAKLTGDSIWAYKNVLKYFKKSEDYDGNYEAGESHGKGGDLYVGKQSYTPPINEHFWRAVSEMKYPIGDINTAQGMIFSRPEVTIKDGRRRNSFPSFIRPVLDRPNLTIYRYAKAVQIHIDKNKKAVGVVYIRHGVHLYAKATKEIILSAGVIDSPRLLLLSGIGPKEHLSSVGIPTEVDLPVGKNYQDHFMTRASFLIGTGSTILPDRDITIKEMYDYYQNRKGPISSSYYRIGIGMLTSRDLEDKSWPDLYTIIAGQGITPSFARVGGSIRSGTYDTYYTQHIGKDAVQVNIALLRPKSPPGELKLASANHEDPPLINPNIFSHPSDSRRMGEGLHFMANLFENAPSLKSIGAQVPPNPFPGCENVRFKSIEYWDCYVRQVTFSGFHPVGTCKMGKIEDPTTVVDSKLRVKNLKSLRVVDVSIMPLIMTGNPYASAVMIGELASDLILNDWKKVGESNFNNRPPVPSRNTNNYGTSRPSWRPQINRQRTQKFSFS